MSLPLRAFQWDLARQMERLDWLIAQLPRYAAWGYQEVYLHLEDAVDYPSLPGVGRKDAFTHRQLERLVKAAGKNGIGVVPIVNLLGHTQYLIKVPSLRDLNECRAPDGSALPRGQLCPVDPRTLEVAAKLIRDMAPFCTAGKMHTGLDESYHLGRHPDSRAEIARIGLARHFTGYVGQLAGLVRGHGLRMGMWADMLALLPEAIRSLPQDLIAYDWYYYPFPKRPRIELRNFADYDLAAPLAARGIEYWGCPMSGAFRHEPMPIASDRLENIVAWWRRCRATKAAGFLVTSWEGNRLAAELPQAIEASAAGLWLDQEDDPRRLLVSGCRRAFGRKGVRAAGVWRACDAHPFSGYPRWQANERWDVFLDGASLAPWKKEAALLNRLSRTAGLPPAFEASVHLRAYLAERDLFIRAAAKTVASARRRGDPRPALLDLEEELERFARRIAPARAAAQRMWRRSRRDAPANPNLRILANDRERVRALKKWLRQCRRSARLVRTAAPVAGSWQFLITATNFAPAAQKLVVQHRLPSGDWEDLHGFFLIEFQAIAARPHAARIHRVSVPVPWEGAGAPPELRVVVRGFGQIAFSDPLLTDGVTPLRGSKGRRLLGREAPRRGWPDFRWEKDRGAQKILFRRH